MSNYSEEHFDRDSSTTNTDPLRTGDSVSDTVGTDAPATSEAFGSAGDTMPQQSHSHESDELLIRAVRTLLGRNSNPFAAGVYGLMRNLDPSFTFTAVGYPSFRALLNDAVSRGVITLTPAPRGNDVVISETAGTGARAEGVLRELRRDVWDAFVDWSVDTSYALRPTNGQVVRLSPGESDDGLIRIPSATREDQIVWMRKFAELESSDELRKKLLEGLESSQPTREFAHALRDDAPLSRRWKGFLRSRILDRASVWAADHGVRDDLLQPLMSTTSAGRPASRVVSAPNEDVAARDRILAILADLPLAELLQLRIPVEYALRR